MVAKTKKAAAVKNAVKTVELDKLPLGWVDSIDIQSDDFSGAIEVRVVNVDHVTNTANVILPNGKQALISKHALYATSEFVRIKELIRPVRLKQGVLASEGWRTFYGLIEGRIRQVVLRLAYIDYANDTNTLEYALVDDECNFDVSDAVRTQDTCWYESFEVAKKLEAETLVHEDGTVEKRGGEYAKYALTPEQKTLFDTVNAAIEAARNAGIKLALDHNDGALTAINAAGDELDICSCDDYDTIIPECVWSKGAYLSHFYDNEAFYVHEKKA